MSIMISFTKTDQLVMVPLPPNTGAAGKQKMEDQKKIEMERRLVGGDKQPMMSKKSNHVVLVEPGKNIGPVKRRRGRGKKGMESNIPDEGKIRHFFTTIRIPKECPELETEGKVDRMRNLTKMP